MTPTQTWIVLPAVLVLWAVAGEWLALLIGRLFDAACDKTTRFLDGAASDIDSHERIR